MTFALQAKPGLGLLGLLGRGMVWGEPADNCACCSLLTLTFSGITTALGPVPGFSIVLDPLKNYSGRVVSGFPADLQNIPVGCRPQSQDVFITLGGDLFYCCGGVIGPVVVLSGIFATALPNYASEDACVQGAILFQADVTSAIGTTSGSIPNALTSSSGTTGYGGTVSYSFAKDACWGGSCFGQDPCFVVKDCPEGDSGCEDCAGGGSGSSAGGGPCLDCTTVPPGTLDSIAGVTTGLEANGFPAGADGSHDYNRIDGTCQYFATWTDSGGNVWGSTIACADGAGNYVGGVGLDEGFAIGFPMGQSVNCCVPCGISGTGTPPGGGGFPITITMQGCA